MYLQFWSQNKKECARNFSRIGVIFTQLDQGSDTDKKVIFMALNLNSGAAWRRLTCHKQGGIRGMIPNKREKRRRAAMREDWTTNFLRTRIPKPPPAFVPVLKTSHKQPFRFYL
jgi:hypothetical protein